MCEWKSSGFRPLKLWLLSVLFWALSRIRFTRGFSSHIQKTGADRPVIDVHASCLLSLGLYARNEAVEARIPLPFCYRFWHTLVRLETKVGEIVLKSPSLKWKKKQGFAQFSWLLEFAAAESRPPSQTSKGPDKPLKPTNCYQYCCHFPQILRLNPQDAEYF